MDLTLPLHWNQLGVPTGFGHPILESKQFKMFHWAPDPQTSSLVYLEISEAPLLVVDVDNLHDTIPRFETLARSHGGIEHLVWEKTRNGGYHFFFHVTEKYPNVLHREFQGIHIDLLFTGRVFTSPSSWDGKNYVPGGQSVMSLNHLSQLPPMPDWMDNLLCE